MTDLASLSDGHQWPCVETIMWAVTVSRLGWLSHTGEQLRWGNWIKYIPCLLSRKMSFILAPGNAPSCIPSQCVHNGVCRSLWSCRGDMSDTLPHWCFCCPFILFIFMLVSPTHIHVLYVQPIQNRESWSVVSQKINHYVDVTKSHNMSSPA